MLNEIQSGVFSAGRLLTSEEKSYLGDKITRRAFMQRFTQPERTLIRKSTDDIVVDIYEDLQAVSNVVLTMQDTIDSLAYLTSIGILADGRSNTILTNPVEAHEI